MEMKIAKAFLVLVLLVASVPAIAQYVSTPRPGESPPASAESPPVSAAAAGRDLQVEPKNGQSQEQLWHDRYECHGWAKTQSGYDPTQHSANAPSTENAAGADGYRRAMTACLEARGYTVHYGAPKPALPSQAPSPPPPPTASTYVRKPSYSGFQYRTLTGQIEGGYTAAVGATDRLLDDGANIGFGLTWRPAPALPLAVRIDGSYTRFRARQAFLDLYGSNFTSGHDNVYGGDADLQLDLAHDSSWVRLYLFGGAGWYREQAYLRQVSWYPGELCGWYFCDPGYVPVVTGRQRTTSPWHSSWNAGLGFEVATGDGGSFFVEARYQRIAAYNEKLQFVPIRIGLRF